MVSKNHFHHLLIIVFLVMVSFSIVKAVQQQSVLGLILAIVSLGAGTYTVYLIAQMKREQEKSY